jgi:hypothetical protein
MIIFALNSIQQYAKTIQIETLSVMSNIWYFTINMLLNISNTGRLDHLGPAG